MRFVFYSGRDAARARALQACAESVWGRLRTAAADDFRLMLPFDEAGVDCLETAEFVGSLAGWIRHCSEPAVDLQKPATFASHLNRLFSALVRDEWPIRDSELTGCYTAVVYDKVTRRLVVANDVVGVHPVYFRDSRDDIAGGTSLVILGRAIAAEPDLAGILQTITGPDFANYGRRTILSGFKRLLPGERRRYAPAQMPESSFDDTLYSRSPGQPSELASLAESTWDTLKSDIRAGVGRVQRLSMLLSGGWDSRMVVAGLPRGVDCRCITFGTRPDGYEVKVARLVAELRSVEHVFADISDSYFPGPEELVHNVLQTEAAYVPRVHALDRVVAPRYPREWMTQGDVAEYAQSCSNAPYASRRNRIARFLGRGDGHYRSPVTQEVFDDWASEVTSSLVTRQLSSLPLVDGSLKSERGTRDVEEQLRNDVGELLKRIRSHPTADQASLDELLMVYTHVRTGHNRQLLGLSERYQPIGLTMSFRSYRALSAIDLFIRVDQRLRDAFMRLPDFAALACIPSAQIPFMPATSPRWLKNLTWGARSMADAWLIKRVMKTRNAALRQRVLKSTDLVRIYRRLDTSDRVRGWFSGQFVAPERFVNLVRRRAALESRPLTNIDVLGPANTSIMLDLIFGSEVRRQ